MGGSEKQSSEADDGVGIPTKTGLTSQASEKWRERMACLLTMGVLAVAVSACGDHVGEGKDCAPEARATTISGYCLPRYVSLKRDKVYARRGPGVDYPALWVYHAKGLPVQVVAETLEWRRVCDSDGGAVWVHRSMVDGRRTVVALGAAAVPVLKAPRVEATSQGLLRPRALATLDRCDGAWCRIRVDGETGWVKADRLWGVSPARQCR
jgi:SH3-like domain-containing protein